MSPVFADFLFFATAGVYVAAAALFIAYLSGWRAEAADRLLQVAARLVGLGAAMHATQIVVSSLVLRVCPVEGVHFAMSVVSMLACVVYMGMRLRFRIDVVGAFVTPFALTFLLASRFAPMEPSRPVKAAILPFHIAANLLGVALFTLAFAAAVAYLVQEHRLKAKKLGGAFQRLPPLDSLDTAEHKFLLAGFPLLTIGVLTGTLWARGVEVGKATDVARSAFGYVSWILFAGVLLLRAAAGWRGRRAAYGTIAGFGFTVLVLVVYLLRDIATHGAPVAWGGP